MPQHERMITACGVTRSIREWAELAGITTAAIRRRIQAGWPLHEAVAGPRITRAESKHTPRHEVEGERLTLAEIASRYGLKKATVKQRIKSGKGLDVRPVRHVGGGSRSTETERRTTMAVTYQDVLLAIRNDEASEHVEKMIADEHSALTDSQMEDLREELARRDADEYIREHARDGGRDYLVPDRESTPDNIVDEMTRLYGRAQTIDRGETAYWSVPRAEMRRIEGDEQ